MSNSFGTNSLPRGRFEVPDFRLLVGKSVVSRFFRVKFISLVLKVLVFKIIRDIFAFIEFELGLSWIVFTISMF